MNSTDIPTRPTSGPNHDELPVFPAAAPAVFADPAATVHLLRPVLDELARIVDVPDDRLTAPTPCAGYDVAALRHHTLAWLQFFAAALSDPAGNESRLDPEAWHLAPGDDPATIVADAAADIERAVEAGVASQLVVMAEARMPGDAVLAMALGEYLVHGWDLAVATDRAWPPATSTPSNAAAAEAALVFLQTTVQPEYRGPDSGFFGYEVEAPAGASAFERLLCFGGRQPDWTPAAATA
ncbi:MAG: TIGR03086 family metal-binding protein [Actinomycetota bacterium]